MRELRMALGVIMILRNVTMHSTVADCEEMERGKFFIQMFPSTNSWQSIKDTASFALEVVLNYLTQAPNPNSNPAMTSHEKNQHLEAIRSICMATTHDELSDFGIPPRKSVTF